MAESLRVRGLRQAFGARGVLEEVSFAVAENEVLALLGASGSGKTTTLNLIAGFLRPTAGEVHLSGRPVCAPGVWVPPHRRGIGMVFQEQTLWPHLSVSAHLDFVLRAQGVARAERRARTAAQLEAVQLTGRDGALPAQLSGGERQRLAVARALVGRPAVLLLDEPCANLDVRLRDELLGLLTRVREATRCAAVYVTHNAEEAFAVAGRIAVLDGGRLVQMGTPAELAAAPATAAVARLLGRRA